PANHSMPFRVILPLAGVLVLGTIVGGNAEGCDCGSAGRVLDFGIFAQISQQDDFINAFLCHKCCSFCPTETCSDNEMKGWRPKYIRNGSALTAKDVKNAHAGPK